ncbi:hypothetical protein DRQ33_05555, partial [bacterium]
MNDYCQFTFPGLYYEKATINIYNMHNILVKKIEVETGLLAKENSIWDGTDSRGNPMPQGLYLYIIEVDGEIVCNGTVTIA